MEHIYNCIGHELKIPNIIESEGVYLTDDRGKRYMDLESGVWCISLGHKNRQVIEIITRQINTLVQAGFCYSNKIVDLAAEAVLSLANFKNGKCVFLCSGSEAIEISQQIARQLTEKPLLMTLHDSYLGSYSSVKNRKEGWHLFNWESWKNGNENKNYDQLSEEIEKIPKEVAAFIFEPGSASGFVRFPPKRLIQMIVEKVRRNNGKIIVNEVTTGVGRTGKWFGYQHYDLKPDMIAMGKGIGNGYPVSVAALDEEIIAELEKKPFRYAQSHQNDPLGAAVVQTVIQTIEENDLIAEAKRKGLHFLSQLESLVDRKIITAVRGRGLMFAVDIINEKLANELYCELIEQGYIVGNRGSTLRIDPPLIITEDQFMKFIETLITITRRL